MPAADFYECLLYDQMEPFGDRRSDVLAAALMATIANVSRAPGGKAYTLTDFLLFNRPEPPKRTPEDMRRSFVLFMDEHNKKFSPPS